MESKHDWPTILDELKCNESLSSDAELAALLEVSRGYISSVRNGRKGVSLKLAQKILSRLGKEFDADTIAPLFIPTKVRRYVRTLAVIRQQVILRANGHCQLCDMEAPFQSKDGFPYLEMHHVNPIYAGGRDDASNIVALCPNCHRMIEHCPTAEIQERLQQVIRKNSDDGVW